MARKLLESLFWVGVSCPEAKLYPGLKSTEGLGYSFNSWLLLGGNNQDNFLFDGVPSEYYDQYVSNIRSVLPEGFKVSHIIMNHAEPDHSGCLLKLRQNVFPEAKIVATRPGIGFIEGFHKSKAFEVIPVTPKSFCLKCGPFTVECKPLSLANWPDNMLSYILELGVMFSGDVFSSTFWPGSYDDDDQDCVPLVKMDKSDLCDKYVTGLNVYYSETLRHHNAMLCKGLKTIRAAVSPLPKFVCPSHGLPLTEADTISLIFDKTEILCTPKKLLRKVVVVYVSAYGCTAEMASVIENQLSPPSKYELQVVKINISEAMTQYPSCLGEKIREVITELQDSVALLIGSHTIAGAAPPQIWQLMGNLTPNDLNGKFVGVFGSFAWSGEACESLQTRLKGIRGVKVPIEFHRCKFGPGGEDRKEYSDLKKFACDFGDAVCGIRKEERSKTQTQTPTEKKPLKSLLIPYKKFNQDGRIHTWKCIVCGEVFTGVTPPIPCPVCGAGEEAFVLLPDTDEEEKKTAAALEGLVSKNRLDIVIIGGGPAAVAAAASIRKYSPTMSQKIAITIISEEETAPYNRPSLSTLFTHPEKEFLPEFHIMEDPWWSKNGVKLHLGTSVFKIDADRKIAYTKAITENGNSAEIPFDRLIIATGAAPFVPLKSVAEDPKRYENVFSLRTIEDVRSVKKMISAISDKRKAVSNCEGGNSNATSCGIVGGGILALELASELAILGIEVHMVEFMTSLCPQLLDHEGGSVLKKAAASRGITSYTGTAVADVVISKSDDRRISGMVLKPAAVTPCKTTVVDVDFMVCSCGVRPRVEIAKQLGLRTLKAVVVDNHMRTSMKGIFAAGDVVEYCSKMVQTWGNAMQQGAVAGLNAIFDELKDQFADDPSNGPSVFEQSDNPYVTSVFDRQLFSIGDLRKLNPETMCISVNDTQSNKYRKLFFEHGEKTSEYRMFAATYIADAKDVPSVALTAAIQSGIDIASALDILNIK